MQASWAKSASDAFCVAPLASKCPALKEKVGGGRCAEVVGVPLACASWGKTVCFLRARQRKAAGWRQAVRRDE